MAVTADLASGILAVREDGRLLLLQRPAGTWEPPGGRLLPGEGFETGAVRELYEETGLLADPHAPLMSWVGERPGGERLASVFYIGRTHDKEVNLSEEHLDYRWATVEEWLQLPSWWTPENIRRVAEPLRNLPAEPRPEPPLPVRRGTETVRANLGAGTVVLDLDGPEPRAELWAEPRALLLRRRKPPVGLWENPGGMLEAGEDFVSCARRETAEETGLALEPESVWWSRVEPWRGPGDPEIYAGVGFLARYAGGEVVLEESAHDAYTWATLDEWRDLPSWYTAEELDSLRTAAQRLKGKEP